MIHTYLISCGNHFIVTPLYIYIHLCIYLYDINRCHDRKICSSPQIHQWTYYEPTEIDAETTSQAGRSAFLHFLEQNTHPKVRTIHEHLAAGHYLSVEKCQWQPSEKLWETCLCFPMNSGKRALFQRTSTVSQDVRYNPIWKSSCEMFPGQKKHPAEATKQKKIRSGSNIKTPVISNHLIVNLTLSCTTVFVCF